MRTPLWAFKATHEMAAMDIPVHKKVEWLIFNSYIECKQCGKNSINNKGGRDSKARISAFQAEYEGSSPSCLTKKTEKKC